MTGRPDDAVDVMVRMVEAGSPEALEEGDVVRLLGAFDLTGVEVRSGWDGRSMWRWGGGRPGAVQEEERLTVVPLGGTPSWSYGWRLLGALLRLLMPDPVAEPDSVARSVGALGTSRAMQDLRRELVKFAPTDITVLLQGETGAGKEVAARALHNLSGRAGNFVPVNIAAMPGSLLEAELFGALRGAFTGADRSRRGLVDRAERGTLFLDEVGDVDPRVQLHLLRFLES